MAKNGSTAVAEPPLVEKLARIGATIEYAKTLDRQAALRRLFAGVDGEARRMVMKARMEKARAARKPLKKRAAGE